MLRALALLIPCAVLRAAGAPEQPPATATAVELVPEETRTIRLFVGRSTVVKTPWPVKTVSVTEPKIANVEILTARHVLVLGKSAGFTDVILLSEDAEKIWTAGIDVEVDVARIKADLTRLMPDCPNLDVSQSGDIVLVTGQLSRAEQVERLHRFLDTGEFRYVDMTTLAGVQQVQLQVRIAEVSRAAIRALGINALAGGTNDNDFFGASLIGSASGGALNPISIGPPAGAPAGTAGVPFLFSADVTVSPLVTILAGFPRADLEFFLQALKEDQFLRILAEPNLVALSGEEASFLAGGEFPIPVVQGGGAAGVSVSIEYKEFGVRLDFRPTVIGDGTIRLHVAPEVSELSDVGAVEIQGFRVPAVVTRRVETTLQLKSGQTFAMAGLLQQTNVGRNSRVPGLGDLPVIGALFRSVRYERGETELLILVTAFLVEPLSTDSVPILPGSDHVPPNDWELYAEGRVEGRAAAKISAEDSAWLKESGLARLKGHGAWAVYDNPVADSRASLRVPRTPGSWAKESGGAGLTPPFRPVSPADPAQTTPGATRNEGPGETANGDEAVSPPHTVEPDQAAARRKHQAVETPDERSGGSARLPSASPAAQPQPASNADVPAKDAIRTLPGKRVQAAEGAPADQVVSVSTDRSPPPAARLSTWLDELWVTRLVRAARSEVDEAAGRTRASKSERRE